MLSLSQIISAFIHAYQAEFCFLRKKWASRIKGARVTQCVAHEREATQPF